MKRTTSFIYLVSFCLISGVLTATPSTAIFGLSACEKAKSQILDLELQIDSYLNNVRGFKYTNNVGLWDQEIFILTKEAVKSINSLQSLDPIPKIWKLAYNNPKCFTNTQKLRIKELGKLKTEQLASYYSTKKYKSTSYCKGAYYSSNSEKKLKDCFIEDVIVLGKYSKYKSVYSY